jgi:hypothetical protein
MKGKRIHTEKIVVNNSAQKITGEMVIYKKNIVKPAIILLSAFNNTKLWTSNEIILFVFLFVSVFCGAATQRGSWPPNS